ncbi:MAG: hypothetical protein PWK00_03725, partial [Coxiella burnetii]|nr:hypothetical protein [Coxiella burnetii]
MGGKSSPKGIKAPALAHAALQEGKSKSIRSSRFSRDSGNLGFYLNTPYFKFWQRIQIENQCTHLTKTCR